MRAFPLAIAATYTAVLALAGMPSPARAAECRITSEAVAKDYAELQAPLVGGFTNSPAAIVWLIGEGMYVADFDAGLVYGRNRDFIAYVFLKGDCVVAQVILSGERKLRGTPT